MCKAQFEKTFNTFCFDLPNKDNILAYLAGTDFYTSPASISYHGNFEGGLCKHSLCVLKRLVYTVESVYRHTPCNPEVIKSKTPRIYPLPEEWVELKDTIEFIEKNTPYSMTQLAFVALLHDICKIGCYALDTKNVKNKQTGKWDTVPFYKWDEQFVMGHGSKSLWMIQCMTPIQLKEAQAILYHMGAFACGGNQNSINDVSRAFEQNELALLLHIADMETTYMDKV